MQFLHYLFKQILHWNSVINDLGPFCLTDILNCVTRNLYLPGIFPNSPDTLSSSLESPGIVLRANQLWKQCVLPCAKCLCSGSKMLPWHEHTASTWPLRTTLGIWQAQREEDGLCWALEADATGPAHRDLDSTQTKALWRKGLVPWSHWILFL